MLTIKDLTIQNSKGTTLLESFCFTLAPHHKAAIIGEEGNGKSTLLKAIADPQSIEKYASVSGIIDTSQAHIGYLSQKMDEKWNESEPYEYCLKNDVNELLELEQYNELENYQKLCVSLHLNPDFLQRSQKIKTLSGGEKVKLQLLKIMHEPVDTLLLDEPTNDLDIETLEWLETFLLEFDGALMFISHDETLLSRVANRIVLLEAVNKKTKVSHTIANIGYDEFMKQRQETLIKEEQIAHKEKEEYEKKQEKLNRIMSSVHEYQNTITRQDPAKGRLLKKKMHSLKSMEKRFEKEGYTKLDTREEAIDVHFEVFDWNPNKICLDLFFDQICADERILIQNVHLFIKGSEKAVIIGDNGCGKTTLIHQVYEQCKQREDLKIGYMPQNYQEMMDDECTPVEYLAKDGNKEAVTKAREFLGRMKFTRDEMLQKIKELSEGQKAKLYLVHFIIEECTMLILDEPTRNLSPLSNPTVREMLRNYSGAILAVSHDRKFIEEVADTVYEIKDKQFLLKEKRNN